LQGKKLLRTDVEDVFGSQYDKTKSRALQPLQLATTTLSILRAVNQG
jgi:hypothetical protein